MNDEVYVFDIDNTLFDTSPLILNCYQESTRQIVGQRARLSEETRQALASGATWDSAWRRTSGLTLIQAQKIQQLKHKLYLQNIHKVKPFNPILRVFLNFLADSRVVIWSNARHEVIVKLLNTIGVSELTLEILSRNSMVHPKPSPAGLIEFLRVSNVPFDSVCVFDDSPEAIDSVREYGIATCLWRTASR